MTDIITITEADLARLQSWEFEEVWRAVGYVYRRRAQAPAMDPAPVPLAPVEAPPVVPPGRAPGENEGAKGQDVHANGPRATTDPACPECGKVCKPKGIGTHRRIAHGFGQSMAECTDCGVTMTAPSLAKHRAAKHAETDPHLEPDAPPEPPQQPSERERFTCGVCGYAASGPLTLEAHERACRAHPKGVERSTETPRAETFVLEPEPATKPGPWTHVHRYELGRPEGGVVIGLCGCGHRKVHPADLNGDISRNGKRSPNPKCPQCGKHALRDRHGYWCNGCQLEVLAS